MEQEYVMFEWKRQRMSIHVQKPITELVLRRKFCELFKIRGDEISAINVFNAYFGEYEVVDWNALPTIKRFEAVEARAAVPTGGAGGNDFDAEEREREDEANEVIDVPQDPLQTPPLPYNFTLPDWSEDVQEALSRKDPPLPQLKLLVNKDIYRHIRKTYKQRDLARGDYRLVAAKLVDTYPHLQDGVIVSGQHGHTYRKAGTWVTSLRRVFRMERSKVENRERALVQQKFKRKTAPTYVDPLEVPFRSVAGAADEDEDHDVAEDELSTAELKERMAVLWAEEPPAMEELEGLMKRTCVDRRKMFRNLKKPRELLEEYPLLADLKVLVADGLNHFKRNLGNVRKAYMSQARTKRVWSKLELSRSKFVKNVVEWVKMLPLQDQDKAKAEAPLLVLPALTNDTRKLFVIFDGQEAETDFPVLKIEKEMGSPFVHCRSMAIYVYKQKLCSSSGVCDLGEAFDALVTVLKLYSVALHPRVTNSLRFLLENVYGFPRSKPPTQGMQTIMTYFV